MYSRKHRSTSQKGGEEKMKEEKEEEEGQTINKPVDAHLHPA